MKTPLRLVVLLIILSHLPAAQAQSQYFWGNYVGFPSSASPGSTDGAGVGGKFHNPWGMALDGAGNLFVMDTNNSTIRKVTPDGVVSTFAGKAATTGTMDGTGANARFNEPASVAFDASGNFYVADYGNQTIRYVTSTGVVTTPYGTVKTVGHADGVGNAATFNSPTGLAIDASGNIFVADYNNYVIRKIVPSTGQVSTAYGTAGSSGSNDGQGTAARFYHPLALAFDKSGNLYVADTGNDTIRKITPAGYVSTFAGSAGLTGTNDGTGSAARFSDDIVGVSTDTNGNIYVADGASNTIRKITPAGLVSTIGGSSAITGVENGLGASAQFGDPAALAVVGNGSVIYVADYANNRIVKGTNTPAWHSLKVSTNANAATGARPGAAHTAWEVYYYKGTDNNIWAEYDTGGSAWAQQPITTDANVSDWLVFGTQSNLLCYLGNNGQICCVYWDGSKWVTSTIGTVPGGVSVQGDLVIDNTWNIVYFRATDGYLHAATWNGSAWVYSTIGTHTNVKGNLAVDQKYHLVYYQGTDNQLWCASWTGSAWEQTQLTTTANVGGAVGADVGGLAVYYRSSADNSAWCSYWNGKNWIQETLNASANISSSATSFSDMAPYPAVYDTLYLDNNLQCRCLYWTGSFWTNISVGDGAWNLTGGLSIQPSVQWIFARRSDGNIIVFGSY